MPRKLTRIEVIDRANEVHGYKYIYDKMEYVDSKTKVCITCPEHGDFWQAPHDHLKGCGCPECSGKKKMTLAEFVKKAKDIHGDKYLYDKVEYVNNSTKVCITCPEHGDFWQTPHSHLEGRGCPECSDKKKKTVDEFIKQAKEKHRNQYIYDKDKIDYINNSTKVCITCPIHGDFWQAPHDHLSGRGCPECGGTKKSNMSGFIKRAKETHGDKYMYNNVIYVDCSTKIELICPIHGKFWQRPCDHINQKQGCPKCGHIVSKAEDEINSFINNICGIETKTRDRSLLTRRLECDILVPSHKLAIEFDGIIWHNERFGKNKNYHLHKTELAESKGYHLIHIFEDEWLEHKELVLNKIKHFLGCDIDKPVIGARKCVIKTISKALSEKFLTTYHLQGFVPSTAYYGAFYGDVLVAVMTFKQERQGMWNLTRFATNTDYRLPGLASKIFKQFVKENSPMEVKTFLDRRWSHCDSNLYNKMNFKLVKILSPDYKYVVKNKRLHKFGFRKQILHKKYNLPLTMTEKEMTEQLGFYRIWDCGLYKYIWKASA